MIRFLLSKIFKRNFDGLLYIIPFINIVLCYALFTENIGNDYSRKFLYLIITSFFALVGIGVTLRRFIKTLQSAYNKSNFYIILNCIFTIITFFAVIYTLIYMVLPNSFAGLNGTTPFDKCTDIIYFSIITFTTLGYGDIYPLASIAKIFISVETLSFFIFFGIIASNHTIFINPKVYSDKK